LESQRATATIDGFSRSVTVSRDCPQGVVLSSLLWCLVVNELLARLIEGGVYSQGYGDDICLLVVGKFPNTVSGLIQWALYTVEALCDELSLLVNPDKTGLVAFTRRRKLPGFFEPSLFGMTLQCPMSVKYLGVILVSRLIWREHVDVKVRKAQNLLLAWDPGWFTGYTSLSLGHPILGMVAWLSDSQCYEETKQNPKVSMLRDNRSNAHYSHQCCGGAYLPPPTAASGIE
jgi:hypothetical protein